MTNKEVQAIKDFMNGKVVTVRTQDKEFLAQYKCRWHDLRRNKSDLPNHRERVLFYTIENGKEMYYTGVYVDCKTSKHFDNDDYEGYATQGYYNLNDVIAWRYIEPFRGGEEDE